MLGLHSQARLYDFIEKYKYTVIVVILKPSVLLLFVFLVVGEECSWK
mgnify:CR=1 FL=1